MRATQLLVSVAAVGGSFWVPNATYYDMTRTGIASYQGTGHNYAIHYEEVNDKDCDVRLPASFDHAGYQAYRADCVDPDRDLSASPLLCASKTDLEDLCSSIVQCESITYNDNTLNGAGFLNTRACGAYDTVAADVVAGMGNIIVQPGTDMFYKVLGQYVVDGNDAAFNQSCPLGIGAEILNSVYPELNGLYEKVDPTRFDALDGYSQVIWHRSHCGWVVQRYRPSGTGGGQMPSPSPSPSPTPCDDDNDAAADLFAADIDDGTDVCGVASAWSESYCDSETAEGVVFSSVCPIACGTNCARRLRDDDDTLAALAMMGGEEARSCASANCRDPHHSRACPETCSVESRRLAYGTWSDTHLKRAGHLRRFLRDAKLTFKHSMRARILTAQKQAERQLKSGRKLGFAGNGPDFEEYYRTFSDDENMCPEPVDDVKYQSMMHDLYDVRKWHAPLACNLLHTCPGDEETWTTEANKYVQRNNIPVRYNRVKKIVDNGCFYKCHREDDNVGMHHFTNDTITDGMNDWCSGHSENYTIETNAICGPRELCEELCDLASADGQFCNSFDMHKTLPQCYLNMQGQGAEASDNHWQLVSKGLTPNEADSVNDVLRDTWTTYTGRNCSNFELGEFLHGVSGTAHNGVLSRADCEEDCSMDPSCSGFQMYEDLEGGASCQFFNETITCNMDALAEPLALHDHKQLSDIVTVLKTAHGPCTVEVNGDDPACAPGGLFYGTYEKDEATGGAVYLKTSPLEEKNTARLSFEQQSQPATDGCDSWYLEENTAAPTSHTFTNCTDYPAAANEFLSLYWNLVLSSRSSYPNPANFRTAPLSLVTSTGPDAEVMDHPCQWGSDTGLCDDAVFHGLCAHTCTELQPHYIPELEKTFWYQDTDMFLNDTMNPDVYSHDIASDCLGDNNWAAYTWLDLYFSQRKRLKKSTVDSLDALEPAATCEQIANGSVPIAKANTSMFDGRDGSPYFNYTYEQNPCTETPFSNIIQVLCQDACSTFARPGKPTMTVWPPDETNLTGALYEWMGSEDLGNNLDGNHSVVRRARRRLARTASKVVHRAQTRVLSYTTSGSGRVKDNTFTVQYMQGRESVSWDQHYASFANGSDVLGPYTHAHNNGETCATGAGVGSQEMFDQLTRDGLYELTVQPAASYGDAATLGYVCRGGALSGSNNKIVCPELTTCILAPLRFDDEMALLYGDETQYMTYAGELPLSSNVKASVLDFVANPPKVLVTDFRATGVYHRSKFEMTPEIFRDVPSPTRVTLTALSAGIEKALISVVSPTAVGGFYADQELGRTYGDELPAGYASWATDVIRVEAFKDDDTAVDAGEAIDVTIRAGLLFPSETDLFTLFKIVPNGDPVVVADVTYSDGGVLPKILVDGFLAKLEPGFDYIGALDLDECKAAPCAVHSTCNRDASSSGTGGYTCVCDTNYQQDGDGNCALDPEAYTAADGDMDYYLRISHGSSLMTGWTVNRIKLYEATDCSGAEMDYASLQNFPSETGSTTFDLITSWTKVYTGKIGFSHYPHAGDSVFGAGPNGNGGMSPTFTYWNKNMFSDSGAWKSQCFNCNADEPVTIEFIISGAQQVGCIAIDQDENYASSILTVERGPARGRDGCGMMEGQARCDAGMTWTNKVAPSSQISLGCGMDDRQIFGEIMHFTSMDEWEGSYANNHAVASACHCHQLCVNHKEVVTPQGTGCQSWKYYFEEAGIAHCYLQSSVFSAGEGHYGEASQTNTAATSLPAGKVVKGHTVLSGVWTSGYPAKRFIKNSVAYDKPLLLGMTFTGETVAISGVGLPYSATRALDGSDLQRMKVVRASDSCSARIPDEVSGVACVQSTRGGSSAVFTFCGPKPASASGATVSFGGIAITATENDEVYKVCYCAYDCYEPTRWQEVPGTIPVAGSVFTWTVTDSLDKSLDVLRTSGIKITVRQPLAGSHGDNADWELKIVRDWFGCEFDMTGALFGVSDTAFAGTALKGPDESSWSYTLDMTTKDSGSYTVCFRKSSGDTFAQIPSAAGDKFLTVSNLADDTTHPRGIFQNQYFSALAGASVALPITVEGTLMAVPSSSRIALTKGTCGDMATHAFPGSVVARASDDTTAPMFLPGGSYPDADGVFGPTEVISLAFDEPVMIDDTCTGNFIFTSAAADPVHVPCADGIVVDNTVMLKPALGDETYALIIETGAVSDLAGNALTLTIPGAAYGFTVTTAADDMAPMLMASTPQHHSSMMLNETGNGTVVTLKWSEDIAAVVGARLLLIDCGSDLMCSDDDDTNNVIEEYAIDGTSVKFGDALAGNANEVMVTLGPAVRSNKLYKLLIPVGSVSDASAGPINNDEVVDVVFFIDESGFSVADTVKMEPNTASADAFVFNLHLGEDTEHGAYSVCFCNSLLDEGLEDFGDFENTYHLHDEMKANVMTDVVDPERLNMTGMILGLDVWDHVCETKCATGCIGPTCFCGSYQSGDQDSNTLCLPKEICAQACDLAGEGCVGINVHDDDDLCMILSKNDGGAVDVAWQLFAKEEYTACSHFADFSEKAGTLYVTKRVDVGVDYVVTPGGDSTLEITAPDGASFNYLPDGTHALLSKDRITVIDCDGTCGVSHPSKSVQLPNAADALGLAGWANYWPYTYFNDEPHDDMQNPAFDEQHKYFNEKLDTTGSVMGSDYYGEDDCDGKFDEKYCAGSNIDVTDPAYKVAFSGIEHPLVEHQCFTKCGTETGCTGDFCHCDGFFSGYDTANSNALCADQALCQYLCDNLGADCQSIDMHKDLPRCFLNGWNGENQPGLPTTATHYSGENCNYHMDHLASDSNYKLIIKVDDWNDEQLAGQCQPNRRMQAPPARRMDGVNIDHVDLGYSYDSKLVFRGLTFTSGGRFKMCFCDSHHLRADQACSSTDPSHYSVEVGSIHASGVSCLLADAKLQRVSCVPMGEAGQGLRCYNPPMMPPALPHPTYAAQTTVTLNGGGGAGATFNGNSNALYQPEENSGQQVGGFSNGVA